MFRPQSIVISGVCFFCAIFAGCRANENSFNSTGQSSGNSSVVLAMTSESQPSNITILSAEVTLTGATLNPGNISLFSGSKTIELTRLQTDTAYLTTASSIPAGSYTSVTLTFANPSLTIENDSTAAIGTCMVGSICTMAPTTVANLGPIITLSSFSLAANSTAGLLVDVNLTNLLSATLGADFMAGTSVSSFTPGGTGAPLVGAEDVVGQITALDTTHNTFSIQNVMGTSSLAVDGTSTFFQFPSTLCATPGIACLRANQIVSVDISIGSTGATVARNVVYEDADNSDTEVEGMITGTNAGAQQFNIVTLAISATGTGLNIGDIATVHYSVSPQTPFTVDFVHADKTSVSTTGYLFAMPTDLSVGQEVSVRCSNCSSGTAPNPINADRVLLRSSRITATVHTVGAPYIYLYDVPSILSGNGVTQIQVQTSSPTIYSENNVAKVINDVFSPEIVAVRGPMFNLSGGGTRYLVASKVVIVPVP